MTVAEAVRQVRLVVEGNTMGVAGALSIGMLNNMAIALRSRGSMAIVWGRAALPYEEAQVIADTVEGLAYAGGWRDSAAEP